MSIAGYTYGKCISNSDATFVGESTSIQNGRNFHQQQGLCTQDFRQRLTLSWVYDLPLGRGKRWMGQAPRALGLMAGTAGFLFLLGGLVQINPVWLWGPYHTYSSTYGAQPDWYLGWLIGALRLMPSWDFTIGSYTVVPNAFWGGALFPLAVFAFLYLWPVLERRVGGDRRYHNLLDRPRDNPWRTGIGVAFVTWVLLVFVAGGADRIQVLFDLSYSAQIWLFRVLFFVAPPVINVVLEAYAPVSNGVKSVSLE